MESAIYVLGGAAWINLANTECRINRQPSDLLPDAAAAGRWLAANGIACASEELESVWRELLPLRELCLAALRDLEERGRLADCTIAQLSERTAKLAVRATLASEDQASAKPLALSIEGLTAADDTAYRVIRSLVDMLATIPVNRLRKCEHEHCVLRFVDTSKGGKRRWCSMEICGNRRKAAEFYAKNKGKKPAAAD